MIRNYIPRIFTQIISRFTPIFANKRESRSRYIASLCNLSLIVGLSIAHSLEASEWYTVMIGVPEWNVRPECGYAQEPGSTSAGHLVTVERPNGDQAIITRLKSNGKISAVYFKSKRQCQKYLLKYDSLINNDRHGKGVKTTHPDLASQDEGSDKEEEISLLAQEEQKRKEEKEAELKLAAEEAQKKKVLIEKRNREIIRKIEMDMVDIPTGSFLMGDPRSKGVKYLKPVHKVNIPFFRMGKNEVTFDQWDICVTDGYCNGYNPKDEGWGRGSRPVINISWDDAQEFIYWLKLKTGDRFRLPSEAEWEYAARAGTESNYHWGDNIGKNNANCSVCESQWDRSRTAPVGSFPANAFGLHDMHGNISEWTQDCGHDNYDGAPSDGSAWIGVHSCYRTTRGGSFASNPIGMLPFMRGAGKRSDRSKFRGFRLALDK